MDLLDLFMLAIIDEGLCPQCLTNIDQKWVCDKCGYDSSLLLLEYEDEYEDEYGD